MEKTFIVETSARHVHVTAETLDILYGKDYKLTPKKDLSQPGQFACEEKVTVVGPKGELKMSILGPVRPYNQVEVSKTDARSLGLNPPIRESGKLEGTPGCKLVGPAGEVEIKEGVIVALRHVHFTPKDAEEFGVKDKEIIKVCCGGEGRKLIFDDVLARVTETSGLAMHIDTDESNAAYGATTGYIVR
ncbi:MAG: phosphate propanoyltransferase [Pygmaiobacter massiliensis]|nr:phosphate propanoyltransferase [Pygmaiobacter massiliensis]